MSPWVLPASNQIEYNKMYFLFYLNNFSFIIQILFELLDLNN